MATKKDSSSAMLARNRLGTLILTNAPEEKIAEQRVVLAAAILEKQIQVAMKAGVTSGKISYMARKIAKDLENAAA